MKIGPEITEKSILARQAESEIKRRLDTFSIVNKVQTDIGIDFHCELIENRRPSQHFFVQAKGVSSFGRDWNGSIKKSTVMYWLQQMAPVFLIVWEKANDSCFWLSIENNRFYLLSQCIKKGTRTIQIKVDRTCLLDRTKKENSGLINKIKDDYRSVLHYHGIAQPKGEQYVRGIPDSPRTKGELIRFREQVRQNLYAIINHSFNIGDLDTARVCCEFLVKFDKAHYNQYAWLGMIYRRLGRKLEAKENLQHAREMLIRDTNWPMESKRLIILHLQKEMSEL